MRNRCPHTGTKPTRPEDTSFQSGVNANVNLDTHAKIISNESFFPKEAVALEKKMTDIRLMWLETAAIAEQAKPGQFIMVKCDDLALPRPLSIHRVKDGAVAILFAVLRDGKGTGWLSQRLPGETLQVVGPLGNGFTVRASSRKLLLVSGGMGIAPLYFLAEEALTKRSGVTLLLGAHTGHLLYPKHLLPPGIEVLTATDDGSDGHHGMVTSLLAGAAHEADQVFACGPIAMYREMSRNKRRLGLDGMAVQVSVEATMGCGHGVCYGCTIGTTQGLRQVCKDGPVFGLDEVSWADMP